MKTDILWRALAKIVSRPVVADYLIKRAKRTPYFHLDGYMDRYWLFNRYSEIGEATVIKRRFPKLPSVRIHHILRADTADHMHDHPWNARTIILKGNYTERRLNRNFPAPWLPNGPADVERYYVRHEGSTAPVNFGEYHSIDKVSKGGVWTMFFTWEYVGTWGFLVDGVKVPWREYTGREEKV